MENQDTIRIGDTMYISISNDEYDCGGCSFLYDGTGCQESNKLISCTGDREIIWRPYSKVTHADEEVQKGYNVTAPVDSIVAEIRELLLQRSQTGTAKYGTTLDRKDLKPSEWCQHLLEELLDASGYVLRLKKDLQQIEALGKTTKD